MPHTKQPSSLAALTQAALAAQLVSLCRTLQTIAQDTTPAHALSVAQSRLRPLWLSSLPGCVRARLLEEGAALLAMPVPDTGAMGAGPVPLYLLSLLLAPDIHHLRVELCCYYGCSHQAALLRLLATQGSGLESLQLARSALLRLDHNLLHSALLSATSLKKLVLQNIASDTILNVIGSACKNLSILDVAHSRQVTDAGIKQLFLQVEIKDKSLPSAHKYVPTTTTRLKLAGWARLRKLLRPLAKLGLMRPSESKLADVSFLLEYCESRNQLCQSLRILNIANTAVTSTGVVLALRSAPSIQSLGDYCHMGRALEIYEKVCGTAILPQFKLRTARSSRTDIHRLELLAIACPELQRLSLSEPHHTPESLSLLPTTLTSLSLHGVPNSPVWTAKLLKFLEGPHGKNLKELVIRFFLPEFLTQLDLGSVLKSCTNLKSFILDGANVDWLTDTDGLKSCELEMIHLGKSVTAKAVMNLMKCALNLKRVHFYSCLDLTDVHLLKVHHPHLECFYIYEASCISSETIHTLLRNCPSIQSTGNLGNWGMTCDDVCAVVSLIKDNNFELQLNTGSHWFCSQCFPSTSQY